MQGESTPASAAMLAFDPAVREALLPGGRFAWLEAGPSDGRVALCLHGFPDHPRTWEPILAPLVEAGFRVVAPFLRGYAPSPLHGPWDGHRLGTDACELAHEVGAGNPVVLVGHDWGAIAGWHAVAQSPLVFSAWVALSVPHPAAMVRNLPRHPGQLLRSWYVGLFQIPWLPERLIAVRDFAAVEAAWRADMGTRPPYWEELRATLRNSLPGPLCPYRSLLRRPMAPPPARVPTLYLGGSRDPSIAPEMAEGQERFVEGPFESALLPAGHFLHHHLADEVARRILAFVAEASPP